VTVAGLQRTVLLSSTTRWPFVARIALRFAALGWRVAAICPIGHPLRNTAAVTGLHDYPALWPAAGLRAAVEAAAPDLIVPCDDRAVAHLQALRTSAPPAVAAAVGRSLGRAESYRLAYARSALIGLAREAGLPAPPMRAVADAAALRAALGEIGLPAVLKVDGSWGGLDVAVVHTPEQAEAARARLARRLDAAQALKRLLLARDAFYLRPWLARAVPRVNVQRYVRGRPANSLAACWQGEVLAAIHVEVLQSHGELGASTTVRAVAHPDMARATEVLVRRLGLSGFCGLDFMIEDGTGDAHLIEMNPRATPICHLALGAGRDPVAALAARARGAPPPSPAPVTDNPVIAFFPAAWLTAPQSELLRGGYHDVPWEDPALVRELMRPPYADRGLSARLLARLRRLRPPPERPAAAFGALSLRRG
jgi:hypothetical protein